MSKGDTTIRIDMEVAGASSAKMTAKDVYQSIESASKKATSTEEAEMKKRAKAAKDFAKFKEKTLKQNQAQEYRDWQRNEQKKIDSVASLQAQRSRETIARFRAEEQEKKRIARETAAEMKRIAREQERDSKRRMREEARDAKMLAGQRGMVGGLMSRGLWAGAMGIAGYAGVAGVSNIMSGIVSGIDEIASKRSELEKAITPLVSLGDNVERMGEMRAEVIGLGATMGMSNKEIAAFLESLNSLSNTMAPEVLAELKRESLQLTELTGGDLQTNMRMLAKTNEIYADSFDSIDHAQNKLFKTQQDADVPMEEMAYRMPELMASAKQLGFTFDEVAAGVITTTIALGRSEGAFTGLRNVFAAMEESEKKGIRLTGTFAEKLDQLKAAADAGKVSLLDLFGRDPLAAGGALLERSETVRENVSMLEGMDSKTDTVGKNLQTKYEDKRFTEARLYDLDKALMENSANIAAESGSDNVFTRFMDRYKAGHHAGSSYAGDFPLIAKAFGIAGAFGNDSIIEEGERVRLANTSEGSPLRNELLKRQFEDQKQRDLMAIWRGNGEYYTFDPVTQKNVKSKQVTDIENRQFVPEKASADQPSLEKTTQIASGIDESNKILREIRDGLRAPGANLKPGGGRANAEETL